MRLFSKILSLLISINAFAMPAKVIILRHAEKDPVGNTLNSRGYARAQALIGFFKKTPVINEDGPPTVIFAANPLEATSSVRPIETVTPLAQSLNLKIDLDFQKTSVNNLVSAVLTSPALDHHVIVICWVRESIIDLLQSFGVKNIPAPWPSDLFDRAMILDFNQSGLIQYRNISQHLLPGDTEN